MQFPRVSGLGFRGTFLGLLNLGDFVFLKKKLTCSTNFFVFLEWFSGKCFRLFLDQAHSLKDYRLCLWREQSLNSLGSLMARVTDVIRSFFASPGALRSQKHRFSWGFQGFSLDFPGVL